MAGTIDSFSHGKKFLSNANNFHCPAIQYGCRAKPLLNHFTVVCLAAWPLNGSEAEVDHVLIKPHCFSYVNYHYLA